MRKFLCSLNKKHTHDEVCSFLIEIDLPPIADPNSPNNKILAQFKAIDSDKLPSQYKNFSGDLYWMDVIYIDY